MLTEILTELLGADRSCYVVGEVSRSKRYVAIRISSGNCGELTVGNIPNNNIVGIFVTKHVRYTYGSSTAKVAHVLRRGNGKVIDFLIAEQRFLLGSKISTRDSVISVISLKSSSRNLNVASTAAELILNTLVEADNRIVKRYLVQGANVAARHVSRRSACRNSILHCGTSCRSTVVRDHFIDELHVIDSPCVSGGITIGNLALNCIVILTALVLTVLKLYTILLTGGFRSYLNDIGPRVLLNVFGFLLRLITLRADAGIADHVLTALYIVE